MNKVLFYVSVLIALASCKGAGSGPLVKDPFSKTEKSQTHSMDDPHSNSKISITRVAVKVEPCNDCLKISDILANKKTYSGKMVKVTGQVTKYNPAIMGKNWIHIQDGSEFQGGFDLTITTDQNVAVGQIITFEGKIILDKDFGYGYFYSVLMEEGRPVSGI
jgi:hypothetical protein